MSIFQEGCQLNMDEILAILALAGKQSLVGLRTEDASEMTPQRLWEACAGLMRDAMMTQVDGKFRLCRDLMAVMQPVCQAKAVLSVTPALDRHPQQMLYCADSVTILQPTPFGRFVLRAVSPAELLEDLEAELELEYPQEPPEEGAQQPLVPETDAPWETLREGADVLLEQLHPDTGARTGWLRLCGEWIQWSLGGSVCCDSLTRDTLEGLLYILLRGETTA